jgi:phosphatidylserine synthase
MEEMKVNKTKGITWVLLVVWAVFAVLFVVKLRNASLHPLQNHNPGGLLFLISQAALAAAVILIWQLRKKDA